MPSKKIMVGVIGSQEYYDKCLTSLKRSGVIDGIILARIEPIKDAGVVANQVWVDECTEIDFNKLNNKKHERSKKMG